MITPIQSCTGHSSFHLQNEQLTHRACYTYMSANYTGTHDTVLQDTNPLEYHIVSVVKIAYMIA